MRKGAEGFLLEFRIDEAFVLQGNSSVERDNLVRRVAAYDGGNILTANLEIALEIDRNGFCPFVIQGLFELLKDNLEIFLNVFRHNRISNTFCIDTKRCHFTILAKRYRASLEFK